LIAVRDYGLSFLSACLLYFILWILALVFDFSLYLSYVTSFLTVVYTFYSHWVQIDFFDDPLPFDLDRYLFCAPEPEPLSNVPEPESEFESDIVSVSSSASVSVSVSDSDSDSS